MRAGGRTLVVAGLGRSQLKLLRRHNPHHRLKWADFPPDLEFAVARAINLAADGGVDRDPGLTADARCGSSGDDDSEDHGGGGEAQRGQAGDCGRWPSGGRPPTWPTSSAGTAATCRPRTATGSPTRSAHAAASAVDHVAQAWAARQEAGQFAASLARAEADLAEVQTWALLALRHGHWSHGVADDLDRRCETILDQLIALSHLAGRWTTTVARRAA